MLITCSLWEDSTSTALKHLPTVIAQHVFREDTRSTLEYTFSGGLAKIPNLQPLKAIDIVEATARADSTEITCDSTLVTADGLIRE
jgi:hypothetical protein